MQPDRLTEFPEIDDALRCGLVRRRSELEAKLLAHRLGWRRLDEIRLRRTRHTLKSVLEALGQEDPAEALLRR